jgi:hypothetical protein
MVPIRCGSRTLAARTLTGCRKTRGDKISNNERLSAPR